MRMSFHRSMKGQKGFSLIELLVVVGIIGVLAAVGAPKYNKYMAKSKLSAGQAFAMNLSTAHEAYFTNNNTYTTAALVMGSAAAGTPPAPFVVTTNTPAAAGAFAWTLLLTSTNGTASAMGSCQTGAVTVGATNVDPGVAVTGAPGGIIAGCN